jgi:hypothetical protein
MHAFLWLLGKIALAAGLPRCGVRIAGRERNARAVRGPRNNGLVGHSHLQGRAAKRQNMQSNEGGGFSQLKGKDRGRRRKIQDVYNVESGI